MIYPGMLLPKWPIALVLAAVFLCGVVAGCAGQTILIQTGLSVWR